MNRPVIIVNPISSGSELAPAFAKRNVPSIAVRPMPLSKQGYIGFASQIQNENFLEVYENDPGLVDRLRKLNPLAIIAGTEMGVPLADQLAATLIPKLANVLELSQARTHKGLMQEALEKAGLPVIRTLNTASVDEVTTWLLDHNLTNAALVIKPPVSAGSDKVFYISPGGDWKKMFDYILATPSLLGGRVNETVIVQEHVTGVEYAVDTVSAAGKHVLALLNRYQKVSTGKHMTVFDYVEFVPFDSQEHGKLLEYTERALDALGIRWGAAHSEVMLTSKGPRLIETGARMCGGPVIGFSRAATGSSQVERIVEAYLDGKISTQNYDVKQTVVPVFLASPVSGTLRNVEILDRLQKLPTHLATHMWLSNGDHVRRTVNFDTVLGIVALAGDRKSVFRDYNHVRAVEAKLIID